MSKSHVFLGGAGFYRASKLHARLRQGCWLERRLWLSTQDDQGMKRPERTNLWLTTKVIFAHCAQCFVREKRGGAVTVGYIPNSPYNLSKECLREAGGMSPMGTPVPLIPNSISVLGILLQFLPFSSSPLSFSISHLRIAATTKVPISTDWGRTGPARWGCEAYN